MQHHFSIDESLRFGWEKTKAHSGLLFQSMLTVFAVQVAYSIVTKVLAHTLVGFAAAAILFILSLFLGVGFTVITLKLAQGKHASYSDLMPNVGLVWRYLVSQLLVGVLAAIGLILLIVPGVYLVLRYSMVRFAIIDGAGIIESLRQSGEITRGAKWHLLGFLIIIILINLIGAVLLLVPLLITVPVTMIAYAHAYQTLRPRHASPPAQE